MDTTKILKGDDLMIFDASGRSIAFATSHTLTLTADSQEISCKDSGVWKDNFITKMSWEVSSENLYSEDGYKDLFDKMVEGKAIQIYFGKADATKYAKKSSDSWSDDNALTDKSYGINSPEEAWTVKGQYAYVGKAVISSLTLNAASGDNATYSATFTGTGKLQVVESATGTTADLATK